MEIAGEVKRLKQSDNQQQKDDWRICALFAPDLPKTYSTTTVTSTLHLLEPLAQEIFVITGNFPEDAISSEKIHIINIGIKQKDNTQSPMLVRIFRFMILQLKMSYNLIKIATKIDLVFLAAGASTLFLPALSAKLLQKRIILLRHGTDSFQETNKTDYQRTLFGIGKYIFPPIIDIFIRLNYVLADRLAVFVSDLTDPRLIRYTKKISLGSRFYVDTDFFKISKSVCSRKDTVGYIGRFEEIKGVMNFVKAIPLLSGEPVIAGFMIGGDGPQRGEIEKGIKNANCGDKVTLTGWIPHDKLPQHLNEIKLLVIPSYAEAGPHIVFEAMACGTPVLAAPVGVMPDVIKDGETGFIMEDNSPECIATNIIRALNHPNLNQIAKAACELVEREYTHKVAVDRYPEISLLQK
ncbi:D-inositol-3-phosphate glycosyltransferase [subsurface metagenome]